MARFDRPISGFVVCRNEVDMLGDALASLDFCREIVIVDSGSTDGTLALIEDHRRQGYPIRLIERPWPGFAAQKQFALEACTEAWCLSLDSDERLDPEMRAALAGLDLAASASNAFALRRRDYLPGYGYQPPAVHAKAMVRLVRKGTARVDEAALVHESILTDGPVEVIARGSILHFRRLTIGQEMAKGAAYARLKAKERFARGRRTNALRLLVNPLGRFLKSYVVHRYFLCGLPGLIYAAMLGQYAFLTEAELYRLGLRDGSAGEAE